MSTTPMAQCLVAISIVSIIIIAILQEYVQIQVSRNADLWENLARDDISYYSFVWSLGLIDSLKEFCQPTNRNTRICSQKHSSYLTKDFIYVKCISFYTFNWIFISFYTYVKWKCHDVIFDFMSVIGTQ